MPPDSSLRFHMIRRRMILAFSMDVSAILATSSPMAVTLRKLDQFIHVIKIGEKMPGELGIRNLCQPFQGVTWNVFGKYLSHLFFYFSAVGFHGAPPLS